MGGGGGAPPPPPRTSPAEAETPGCGRAFSLKFERAAALSSSSGAGFRRGFFSVDGVLAHHGKLRDVRQSRSYALGGGLAAFLRS